MCCDALCGIEVGWTITLHCVEWSRGAAAARVVLCVLGGETELIESLKLPFIAQVSNRYVIIWHMIHPRFTLPLPFDALVCTCRPLSRLF